MARTGFFKDGKTQLLNTKLSSMKKTNYENDLIAALKTKKQLQQLAFKANNGNHKKVTTDYIKACDHLKGMQAIVNEIKTTIPNFVPEAAKEQWDNIEIEAVTMRWYNDKKGKIKFECERTDNPKEIYFYSIYLHLTEGGVKCIADLTTEEQAYNIANLLQNAVKNFKDNGYLKFDKPFGKE